MSKERHSPPIASGSRVTLHFSLGNTEGAELTSTFEGEPARILVGDGSLIEGLEMALEGLRAGDEQTIALTAEQAFGARDEGLIHQLPRYDFSAELTLEPGLVIAFETPSGEELAGIVLEYDEHLVRVDFNHPLAGHDVLSRVRILEVE